MKPRLKILQVCLTPSWGGLEMNALKFTRYLLERGHGSACLCQKGSQLHFNLKKAQLPYYALTTFSRHSPLAALKARGLIKEGSFQILHLHTPRDLWLISPAATGLSGVKIFATGSIFFAQRKKKDPLHRLLYRRLDKFICLSSVQKEHMLENLPLLREKYEVLPNPVDLQKFNPDKFARNTFREEWQVKPEETLIGLVGRIDPSKGQREMILAFAQVVKEFPSCKLVFVGEETFGEHAEYAAGIRRTAQDLGLGEKVIWAGFLEEIPQVLTALDIFVMPSHQENFANVLLEAMAMRLPIISTDSGGTPEILDFGRCGLLVPPQQVEPLAVAVLQYLKNPGLRESMAQKAQERAREVYHLERILDRLEGFYYKSLGI